jgi:hypothetical protein
MMLNTEGIRKGGRQQQQRMVERVGGADRGLVEEEVVGFGLVDWEGRLPARGLVFEARLVGSRVRVSTIFLLGAWQKGER